MRYMRLINNFSAYLPFILIPTTQGSGKTQMRKGIFGANWFVSPHENLKKMSRGNGWITHPLTSSEYRALLRGGKYWHMLTNNPAGGKITTPQPWTHNAPVMTHVSRSHDASHESVTILVTILVSTCHTCHDRMTTRYERMTIGRETKNRMIRKSWPHARQAGTRDPSVTISI